MILPCPNGMIRPKSLPDGTFIFVEHGHWFGYITTEDNTKVLYTGVPYDSTKTITDVKNQYVNRLVLDDNYFLDAEVCKTDEKPYEFHEEYVTADLIQSIKDWFEENGKGCNAVIGISGGKDSTIVAALCVKALGKDRVIGVLLPNGEQSDIGDSYEICDILGIRSYKMNIEKGVNATYEEMLRCGLEITQQVRENTPPMERTKCIRSVCRSQNGRMMNTCNWSEDYIGYFTIGGDGEGDFAPLADLTATEVIKIGHYLGLPKNLVDKTPSDGLCGKTDEDNFGFTYAVLDKYIRTGICEDDEVKARIIARHKANAFKLKPMTKFTYRG